VKDVVGALRIRVEQSRQCSASLETWRQLQLEILEAARALQRATFDREPSPAEPSAAREQLWTLLGEAFWMERNVERLVPMVEHAIAVLDAAVAGTAQTE
jgi:hypothetical protein